MKKYKTMTTEQIKEKNNEILNIEKIYCTSREKTYWLIEMKEEWSAYNLWKKTTDLLCLSVGKPENSTDVYCKPVSTTSNYTNWIMMWVDGKDPDAIEVKHIWDYIEGF